MEPRASAAALRSSPAVGFAEQGRVRNFVQRWWL
jgi:hypothetical protein